MQWLGNNRLWVSGVAAILSVYRFGHGGHAREGSARVEARRAGGERSSMTPPPGSAAHTGHHLLEAARFGGGIGVVAE